MYKRRRDSSHYSPKRRRYNSSSRDLPSLHTIFHGEIASVQKYGVFVKLPGYDRHGLVHVSQMSSSRIDDPGEMLARGDSVYCKVISTEENGQKIGLSMKLVSQSTGKDLDPNNVQLSQDEKKRKKFYGGSRPPIELGAVYDTTCRRCGGHGHLAMECYAGRGGKRYDLIPDLEDMVHSDDDEDRSRRDEKKKKERKSEKREKRAKKDKKRKQHPSSSDESSQSDKDSKHQRRSSHKHRN